MDITFIYKNKQITTPNLEKKLKRMGITKEDITIIDASNKPKEGTMIPMYPIENFYFIKKSSDCWECYISETPPTVYDVEYTNQERKKMYERINN